MSDEHELPDPEDSLLEEALSPLKHLQPPLEARLHNRNVVAAELSTRESAEQRPRDAAAASQVSRRPNHWWRRSISVPVPVAAGVLLLAAASVAANVRRSEPYPVRVMTEQQPGRAPSDAHGGQTAVAALSSKRNAALSSKRHEPRFSISETYVCGIGRVSSESHYFDQE